MQVDYLHHHRHAVSGHYETIRAAQQGAIGVVGGPGLPLVEHGLGRQVRAQHLHHFRGGATTGGDIGGTPQLFHNPAGGGYQVVGHLAIHDKGVGLAADQHGDQRLVQSREALAPGLGLGLDIGGTDTHQRQGSGQEIIHGGHLVFGAGDHQGKIQHVTRGLAHQHDLGAIT